MMHRYSDADKADKTLHDLLNMTKQEKETAKNEREQKRKSDIAAGIVLAIYALRDEPTVEAEPVRHGRWIRGKNKSAFPAKPPAIWYCSCCGEMIRYNDSIGIYQKKKKKVNEVNPRCRRCGAKMDGGVTSETDV